MLSKSGDWIDRLRLPLPGRARRAAAAARPARAPALGALVGVRAAPPVAGGRRRGAHPARARDAGAAHAPGHVRRRPGSRGHDDAQRLRPHRARASAPGVNGSFLLATELPRTGDARGRAARSPTPSRATRTSRSSCRRSCRPTARSRRSSLFPKTGPQRRGDDEAARAPARRASCRRVERETGATVYVGGQVASQEDFADVIAGKLPLFVGSVVLLSALLLMVVFRSIFIPIKAALHEPAVDRRGARLRDARLPGRLPRRAARRAGPGRSSRSCP